MLNASYAIYYIITKCNNSDWRNSGMDMIFFFKWDVLISLHEMLFGTANYYSLYFVDGKTET